jgi:hypothetical protein
MVTTFGWKPSRREIGALCKALTVLACSSLTACGSDDKKDNFGRDVEGLYADETFTESAAGCEAEGADVLATQADKMLGIRRDDFVVPFLIVAPCMDATDCGDATGGGIFSGLGGAGVLVDRTASGYAGEGSLSWSPGANGCSGTLLDFALEKLADSRVRFERRSYDFADVPFDTKDEQGNPDCKTDSMRAAAKQQGCSDFRVISAVRQGDLPPPSQ